MLNWFVELLTCFDWLTPIVIAIQNLCNRPYHTFITTYGHGEMHLSRQALRAAGIHYWGISVDGGKLHVRVQRADAPRGEQALAMAGVTVLNSSAPRRAFLRRLF